MALKSGATFAGYRIIRLLGSGGMGEVYLAEHPRLPRREAVKILAPDISADTGFRERFNREADLAATLFHPNVVGVHDRGECGGQLWIAMDFVDGHDAAHLVRRSYPAGMPREDATAIVVAVAAALDHAHGRGLLHRDVKPANILLTDADPAERRIMLADFGIARSLSEASRLTATNTALGTIDYAAPEQLMDAAVDGRADQYSLAATAFHLLTGSPPYRHSSPAVTISRHLDGEPPALKTSRPDLADLDPAMRLALSRDPDRRYPSCRHFAEALLGDASPRPLAAGLTCTAQAATQAAPPRPAPLPPAPPPVVRERPRTSVTAALIAFLLLAAVVAVSGVRLAGEPPAAATASSPINSPMPSTVTSSTVPTSTVTSTVTSTRATTTTSTITATVAAAPRTETVTSTVTSTNDAAPAAAGRGSNTVVALPNTVVALGWGACTRLHGWAWCLDEARKAANAPPGASAPLLTDGSWPVPATVRYGDYRAAVGPLGSCIWYGYDARGRLVDSGVSLAGGGPVRATVTPTMVTFQSLGCTPWFRVTPLK